MIRSQRSPGHVLAAVSRHVVRDQTELGAKSRGSGYCTLAAEETRGLQAALSLAGLGISAANREIALASNPHCELPNQVPKLDARIVLYPRSHLPLSALHRTPPRWSLGVWRYSAAGGGQVFAEEFGDSFYQIGDGSGFN
jgi:hypothetical protein